MVSSQASVNQGFETCLGFVVDVGIVWAAMSKSLAVNASAGYLSGVQHLKARVDWHFYFFSLRTIRVWNNLRASYCMLRPHSMNSNVAHSLSRHARKLLVTLYRLKFYFPYLWSYYTVNVMHFVIILTLFVYSCVCDLNNFYLIVFYSQNCFCCLNILQKAEYFNIIFEQCRCHISILPLVTFSVHNMDYVYCCCN